MTPRERLMATMRGEKVDRPAVSFYEIGGFNINPNDPDEYNVYNAPSWKPLLDLALNHTDIIRLVSAVRANSHTSWSNNVRSGIREKMVKEKVWETGDNRFTQLIYTLGDKKLSCTTRRDKALDTVWIEEPLLKNADDARTFLELPDALFEEQLDVDSLIQQENELGDKGIVMVDTEDPLCAVATLFTMEAFTILAFTDSKLCHKLIEKHAKYIYKRTESVAREFPGRLWRIYGPEYATEPFLPPQFFEEYVVKYDQPMIEMIKKNKGFARLHSHGNVKGILDYVVAMGADAIDPLEPPPQGNVSLKYVRQNYGEELVLFGNLEISDIENMPSDKFRQVVKQSIQEGTEGEGRGFVLMPSSSPYGRNISERTLRNYQIIIEEIDKSSEN